MDDVNCRSIKRGKFDIPDYYPQENDQKEDELTEDNVNRGFTNVGIGNLTPHEYSSAKDNVSQVPLSKFAGTFNNILTKKQKNNTLQDVHKKKPLAQNKEFFLPITSKTKSHVASWLQDLAGRKSLSILASRKVPIFNKKEELLNSVCEHSVPLIRATWFIKMTSAHQMALISDSRNKKRQASEPAQEWTATITKYLKDQLNKLSDFYHQSFQRMSVDVELAQKQWHYTVRLTDWLYEENLLDRQEFFQWVVELMEKVKSDDMILKLILPLVLRYLDQIVHSQVLSRSLALCCTRKLSSLLSAAEQMRDEQKQNQSSTSNTEYPLSAAAPSTIADTCESENGPQSLFGQYKTCAHHQSLVNGLSCILQVITICCPGALIWNSTVTGSTKSGASSEQSSKKTASGSALDKLALSPSELQLPTLLASSCFKKQIENLLESKEEEIKDRSKAVEKRWFVGSGKTSVMEVTKTLEILDFLDKHDFNKVKGAITTEDLYVKIFGSLPKDCTKVSALDEAISILLIQWAISAHRMGKHRAIIVSKLLKKRQSDLRDQLERLDGEEEDETSSKTSNSASSDPYFQNVSLKFLDHHAPIWGDDEVTDSRFCQLVMLYGELIRLDVFSHNTYLCTLISRGDLEPAPPNVIRSASSVSESVLTTHEGPGKLDGRQQEMLHYSTPEESRRSTDSTSELNKQLELDQELMLHQEQLQKLLYQDSEAPEDGFVSPFTGSSGFKFDEFRSEKPSVTSVVTEPASATKAKSQHSLYVKHFPIPKEDNTHELNQRLVVLYGVGKPRITAMKSIKEFSKELLTFFVKLGEHPGRKMEDDKMKAIAEKKQSIYRKFCSFSTFDQYSLVTKCLATIKETASANLENYGMIALYPTFGQLSFIIYLFETCNNIPDLLEFLVDLLEVRGKFKFNPNLPQETSVYGTLPTTSLLVLGSLRKHQPILLLYPELTFKIFLGFLTTVENISDPAICSSTERCILAYLYHLYTSCTYVKSNFIDSFDTACNKIKESIICFSKSTITSSPLVWDDKFLNNYFENSRKEKLDVIWKQMMAPDSLEQIYSFVCNAIINVCNCQDRERLYDIGVLCSEVTAHYKGLSSEWITVLKALCFSSSNPSIGFAELVYEIDLSDISFHESICLFTAMLISRSCFSLEDLIDYALLPALSAAVDSGNKIILEAESGGQLACQLLFRLLDQSPDNPVIPFSVDKFSFEPTPDRSLLYSAQENIEACMIFEVFKAIMKFSEAESRRNEHETSMNSNDDILRGLFNDDLIDVSGQSTTDVFSSSLMSNKSESTSTSSYANSILQKLCSQEWLKEKCLRDHNTLFSSEALMDTNITDLQAKKLLHLICYPNSFPQSFSAAVEGFPSSSGAEIESCKESANRILKNLNRWSFRNSWLELFLMLNKADKEKMEVLLDCISSACLSLFVKGHGSSKNLSKVVEKQDECIKGPEWLVEPLINKLSSGLHSRILKTAGDVLGEKGWWKDQKENGGPSLIHAMSFLHLILFCLQTLGDQREPLLMSLLKQFQDLLEAPNEESHPTDKKSKAFLQDALDLRLRLVGVMFNSIAIQKNLQVAADWGIVLFELISCGIISSECVSGNFNHYTNVLDILSVLINLITSPETSTNQVSDDARKFSNGLFKRLKRKLCEKNPRDIQHCKQLLPFPGRSIEVVTVEKSQHNDFSILSESSLKREDTQEGFQVKGRQKISPWELIEGHKHPAPMAFSWFGAVRIDRKPLPYKTDLSRSVHHNFVKKRPLSYYINPPDDSDDESVDLISGMLGSPGNLTTSLEPKGIERLYSSMTNLNAAVKRELPHPVVEQQHNGEKPKVKRQKKTVRAAQQHQALTVQQQKLLQEHNFKFNPQIFQQLERPYQQPGQPQTALSVRRLQRPQGKPYSLGQQLMLIPKSQPDHLQLRPSTAVQPLVYSGRPQTLQTKQISQSPLVSQKRRQIPQSGLHVDESPIQQLLQSNQAYPFSATQSTQLPVSSHTGLSGASTISSTLTASPSLANTFSSRTFTGPNTQQQLSHQQQLDQQSLQQSFVLPSQGNLQQNSTLLQHPMPMTSSSIRLPVAGQQKQFPQGAMNHPKQSELRTCLLRQTPVTGQNNPVGSQVNLQRQMSAPAKLSLPPQYATGSEVSYQGQIPQTQNIAQSSQTQQFPNFQPPFQ